MAEEVGQAFVSILPSLKGFSTRLQSQLRGELRTIDPVVSQAGDRAGRTFGTSMSNALTSGIARIGSILKVGLVAGTAAAVAGLGALTAFGLKSAASLEQVQIGIEALVGDAQTAKVFLGELQQFAAKTPFEFAGVADASRRILAFGNAVGITREEVLPTLGTIGDLVSVLGGTQESVDSVIRALGQMASKGKVSQEEVLQLAEALPGFNANAAIASSLGLSVSDTLAKISAGGVDATTGINALLKGMAEFPGAAGAMEKQSQTLLGVFSTFKDTISIALTNAFQPVIPSIKQALTDVTPVLGDAIDKFAPQIGNLLSTLLPLVGILSQALTPVLGPAIQALASFIPQLTPALVPLGNALGKLVSAFAPLVPVIGDVIGELVNSALVPVIEQLTPQIADLVPPLADLLVALIPIIPPLGELLAMFIQVQTPLIKLLALVTEFLAIKALAPAVQAVADAFQKLFDKFKPNLDIITNVSNWPQIFENVKALVGPKIEEIGQFFAALPEKISAFISSLPERLRTLALQAFDQMAFAVGFGIGRVVRFFIDLPDTVANLVTQLWTLVGGLFTTGVDNARTQAVNGFDRLVAFVTSLPDRVIGAVSSLPGKLLDFAVNLGSQAYQLGKDIVQGVVNGILATISNVGNVLKSGFDSAVSGVKRGLGIASPSKVFADIGAQTVAGYVKGVEASANQAAAATTLALSPAAAAASPAATPARVEVDIVGGDEPITRAIRESIRVNYGGSVTDALDTAGAVA